ncbi:tetratricopeptide repeat protein [Mycetohabitans sp. B8]|uniref:tetratricopeptide repeat protein n=1 Tax=Mycetohabitans sp. B8 TaxID=2841845 RepID=UPI001F2C3258|nr:tetratricopeptide repeat protein [Mycetohabitans sp. B8]MCG1042198.1 tetratricopeptide repeat protein [Mycetohabitans sp. B8]
MSYHHEQETLDNLQAWWAKWGNALTWLVLAALLAGAAYNGWNWWQRRQAAQAAVFYDTVQQAVASGDKAQIARVAADMEARFGGTAYAPLSALAAAKALYAAADVAGAKGQLQWVVDQARGDAFKAVARLRLAALLIDEQAYDAGLKLLSEPPPAFSGLYADRRGDLLAAQGKRDEARAAYQTALAALEHGDSSVRQLIQFKLDALGG